MQLFGRESYTTTALADATTWSDDVSSSHKRLRNTPGRS